MAEERRRFPRYDYEIEVRYSTQGIASVEGYTVTRNISKVGARITVSRFVKKGDILKMELLPGSHSEPVSGYCRVVWTKNLTKPSAFQTDAGVEFTKFDTEDVDRLLATVK
jgi:hypothetical protein